MKRDNNTIVIFSEIDLSGYTVHVPLTMPILYLLLTFSLSELLLLAMSVAAVFTWAIA